MNEGKSSAIMRIVMGVCCLVTLIYVVKLYSEGRVFDPDVDECRSELMAKLPSPSTFKEYSFTRSDDGLDRSFYIEYASENAYGSIIRSAYRCQ
jgi:hypothetical protein